MQTHPVVVLRGWGKRGVRGVGTRRAVGNKIHTAYRIVDAAYSTGAPYTDAAYRIFHAAYRFG